MGKKRRERRAKALKKAKAEVSRLRGVILAQGAVVQPQPESLKPCPFCGSRPPQVSLRGPIPTLSPQKFVYVVHCVCCGIDGPWSTTPFSAATRPGGWNRRAEVPS